MRTLTAVNLEVNVGRNYASNKHHRCPINLYTHFIIYNVLDFLHTIYFRIQWYTGWSFRLSDNGKSLGENYYFWICGVGRHGCARRAIRATVPPREKHVQWQYFKLVSERIWWIRTMHNKMVIFLKTKMKTWSAEDFGNTQHLYLAVASSRYVKRAVTRSLEGYGKEWKWKCYLAVSRVARKPNEAVLEAADQK